MLLPGLIGAFLCGCAGAPGEAFITVTFGNDPACDHAGTLKAAGDVVRFDLSNLPETARIRRAILRVPFRRRWGHEPTVLQGVGFEEPKVPTRPPRHTSFDVTRHVRAWLADPATNRGLKIVARGRADFTRAVLELGVLREKAAPGVGVTGLRARHRNGQTFLTWREPEDVVAEDAPTFEAFEKAVLAARERRRISYRVYRHDRPLTPATLADAELVREVPEALSCWNLLHLPRTEHPQKGRTKRSPLRGGNIVRDHVMIRWRLDDVVPRATGLTVVTATTPGRRYYAVTVVRDGRETVTRLRRGMNAAGPVAETPSTFPGIFYQRTRQPSPRHPQTPPVDVFLSWMGPPLAPRPRAVEIYMPRWPDLKGSADRRQGLYIVLGTYGSHSGGSPLGLYVRRYVPDSVTVSLAEEGTLWAGRHECLGTFRPFREGVVWNYGQRRVLAVTAWAAQKKEFFVDPERVVVWGQSAGWALRHGDVYAVVMSDGHNNLKTSREGRKHAWKWGKAKNCYGVVHEDYLDMASWLRENPAAELPYWVGAPAYGQFPHHTLGDFGFRPWQDFVTAMQDTRRPFTAVWMSNGPGLTKPFMDEMVPKLRLHQTVPAFTNCSLDARILSDDPKGSYRPGRFDQDFQKHADKFGGINLYQRWETESIVDKPGRWEMTLFLAKDAPQDEATMDLTPRRCQSFRPKPGEAFEWTYTALDGGKVLASGTVTADRWGLVTLKGLHVAKGKSRIVIRAKQ
jgi:hypothetical protein